MGTWGTSIFSNDFASDIRGDWKEALEEGLDAEAATARLLKGYRGALADPDEGPQFWIALAAAQYATGRLQDRVRDEALAAIEAGGDVASFAAEDAKLAASRQRALAKLAGQLRGPQKPPSAVRRPKPRPSPVAIGDVILVRGADESPDRGLFVVVGMADGWPPGTKAPEVIPLAWRGP